MRRYLKEPVEKYVKALASRTIVPGGGSASAVEAALGVALNLMVIEFSIKASTPEKHKISFLGAKKMQERSLGSLIKLADKDSEAFTELMKALSAGKAARRAYIKAASAPLEVCKECLVSIHITGMLLEKGNKHLITDVGCAARMLSSAFHSARLNVLVNLKYMDGAFAIKAAKELETMAKYVDAEERVIRSAVEKELRPEVK